MTKVVGVEGQESSPVPLMDRPMSRSPADLELFRACFARHDSPRSREALEWQYWNNPTGELFVNFAMAGPETVAAIYASLPVFVRVDGCVRLGVQSLDTVTDEAFRGRGLFARLAQSTFAHAERASAAFIYGFPNKNSAHGFFGRLGWTNMDPVPFLVRPLRSAYVLERAGLARHARLLPNVRLQFGGGRVRRGVNVERVATFDERHTLLWQAFAANVGVAVERDARYLQWRLVQKPGESYETFAAYERETCVALVSHCVKTKHGGKIGYVMESLARPGHESTCRALLRDALADMTDRGADVALAWCMRHAATFPSFLRTGFVPFPERFRPIDLHFGARSFDATSSTSILDRRRWYLSYLDSDTV